MAHMNGFPGGSIVFVFVALLRSCTINAASKEGHGNVHFPAIAGRDAVGELLNNKEYILTSTAASCYEKCDATTGCNVWVWCGDVSGCDDNPKTQEKNPDRYKECWLKRDAQIDEDPRWQPKFKSDRARASGWISGTTLKASAHDVLGEDITMSGCRCQRDWWEQYKAGYASFPEATCASPLPNGRPFCKVDHQTCSVFVPARGRSGCDRQPCMITVNADFDGEDILVRGDKHHVASAEECCYQCKATEKCTVWVWCSSDAGCGGDSWRHKECWLKFQDPTKSYFPHSKAVGKAADGWISGAVRGYIPL
ncbi:hypothetical protein BSKO_05649 [Bryopsis sp. KO-2023]|nr:hypothetical protein BSKO_05649 [Bryopsis sp. KO-2023]